MVEPDPGGRIPDSGFRTQSRREWLPRLLTLCARTQAYPGLYDRLRREAGALATWDGVPELAEAHGLVPLSFTHLQAAGIEVPRAARERLSSRYLQHAHASRVRARAVGDILVRLQAAGVDALLVKGAALAHLVYPRPALRPMRDVDLLVPAAEAGRAHTALADIGFTRPDGAAARAHHLPLLTCQIDGVAVNVEIHHDLQLDRRGRPSGGYERFAPRAIGFQVAGVPAHAIGPEDMLWHVYRHAFHPQMREPFRLIWIADLVSLVERWLDRIDWERVRRDYPAVVRVLPVLHALAPLSAPVIDRLRLRVAPISAASRPLEIFDGWPRLPLSRQRWKGPARIVADTLVPPAWWLRLSYGRGPSRLEYLRAWVAHLTTLLAAARHDLGTHMRRLGMRLVRSRALRAGWSGS